MAIPAFPSNDVDFHFEEVGPALAGLIARDVNGNPKEGVLPSTRTLLGKGGGWNLTVAPFVAVRAKGRAVLIGPSVETESVQVLPAPAANARIDVIYTRPADVGAGDPIESVGVVTGIPGAAPVKPSPPEGGIELGTIRLQAGNTSVAQATLTDTFAFSALSGGIVLGRQTSDVSSWQPEEGALAYVLANSTMYIRQGSTGTGWRTLANALRDGLGLSDTGWVNFSVSGWTVQEQPAVRAINGVVYFKGVISNNTFTGGFTNIATIPAAFRPPAPYRTADATMNSPESVKVRASGANLQIYRAGASASWADLSGLSYPLG